MGDYTTLLASVDLYQLYWRVDSSSSSSRTERLMSWRFGRAWGVLGGSWDLVSKVISPLIGVVSKYKYSYLNYNPTY